MANPKYSSLREHFLCDPFQEGILQKRLNASHGKLGINDRTKKRHMICEQPQRQAKRLMYCCKNLWKESMR